MKGICPTCEHEDELVVYEIAEMFRVIERDHGQHLPAHRTGCKTCAAAFSDADPGEIIAESEAMKQARKGAGEQR